MEILRESEREQQQEVCSKREINEKEKEKSKKKKMNGCGREKKSLHVRMQCVWTSGGEETTFGPL